MLVDCVVMRVCLVAFVPGAGGPSLSSTGPSLLASVFDDKDGESDQVLDSEASSSPRKV